MLKNEKIGQEIAKIEAKIERAANESSGNIEDESRIDDLYCEILKLEEEKNEKGKQKTLRAI